MYFCECCHYWCLPEPKCLVFKILGFFHFWRDCLLFKIFNFSFHSFISFFFGDVWEVRSYENYERFLWYQVRGVKLRSSKYKVLLMLFYFQTAFKSPNITSAFSVSNSSSNIRPVPHGSTCHRKITPPRSYRRNGMFHLQTKNITSHAKSEVVCGKYPKPNFLKIQLVVLEI